MAFLCDSGAGYRCRDLLTYLLTYLNFALQWMLYTLGRWIDPVIDIYTVDTVLPVHIVWYNEAIAKSTTQDGGMAETDIYRWKFWLMHLCRSVDVST